MSHTGAALARGKSKQDYATPVEFLDAVQARFGRIEFDLAASRENAVVRGFYSKERDALQQSWQITGGWLWLNPPFDRIEVWAAKCAAEMSPACKILFLTPASVGANWFQNHVVPNAHVIELSPRMSFDGKDPYPKDLILSVFCHGLTGRSHWRWK